MDRDVNENGDLNVDVKEYSVPVTSLGVVMFQPLYAYIEIFESGVNGAIYLAPIQMQNGKLNLVQVPSHMLEVKAKKKSLEVKLDKSSILFDSVVDAESMKYPGTYEMLLEEKFVVPRYHV